MGAVSTVGGVRLCEPRRYCFRFRLRLFDRNAAGRPSDNLDVSLVAFLAGLILDSEVFRKKTVLRVSAVNSLLPPYECAAKKAEYAEEKPSQKTKKCGISSTRAPRHKEGRDQSLFDAGLLCVWVPLCLCVYCFGVAIESFL